MYDSFVRTLVEDVMEVRRLAYAVSYSESELQILVIPS